MSERKIQVEIEFRPKFHLILTEEEVRALDGIFGYSPEAFLNGCYKCLGEHYIRPYANGVRSLHKTVREFTGPVISQINELRTKIRRLEP